MNEGEDKPAILVVDDSKVIRMGAKKMLGDAYAVQLAEDGQEAWEYIQAATDVAVVFTDLNMPKMPGMALLSKIRSSEDERIARLPVVILSGSEDDSDVKAKAMDAGATDFIFKPFDSIELNSRARSYAELSRKLVELEQQAAYDSLTGLYNEKALHEQGEKAVSFALRHGLCVGLCLIDIKHFQEYRLKFGDKVAKTILMAVAKRLKTLLREEDIAARIDATRFAVIISVADAEKSKVVVERLQQDVQKLRFEIGVESVKLALNIGYSALHQGEVIHFDKLREQAQTALSKLPTTGNGQAGYYSEHEQAGEVAGEDLMRHLHTIMSGDYAAVPIDRLQIIAEKLKPFFDYMHQRDAT